MGKKYVASAYDYLGQVCDTEEDAKRAARGIDYQLDSFTGYSSAFNCKARIVAEVIEIDDAPVTKEDYLKALDNIEKEKEKLAIEIELLRKKHMAKYEAIKYAYINNNTPYSYGDRIRLTTKRPSGRKRVVEGIVCGTLTFNDTCEIRPDIRGCYYPTKEPIISIEVLEKKDFREVRQRVVCNNCKYFKGYTKEDNYDHIGQCTKHNKQIYYLHENEYECYENNPEKK